ncbi:MAG: NnrS family protein [Cytophagales bacterium]|nr:NnrS family protein [Rhizobacter sp.]
MKRIPIHPLPTAPANVRWRARHLLVAPHRLAFFAAALMFSASGLWWGGVLLARALDHPLAWALPAPAAHALWMCFGFMPLFIAGFCFTAGPRWLGLPPVDARGLLVPVVALLLSWAVAVPGFHLSMGWVADGLALGAAAWTVLCVRFVGLLRVSHAADKQHATLVAVACAWGALAWWVAAGAASINHTLLLRSATSLALWCFVAPVFMAVSHRMLPFLDAGTPRWLDARQPLAMVWVVCASLCLRGVMAVAELWWWPLPTPLLWGQATFEAAVATLLLWLALRWRFTQNLRFRLLVMLHVGFLWLAVSFALAAVSHAGAALGVANMGLGLAPLHAMTMGYLGTTLFAMATRVVSGHSGHSVAADNLAWGFHWTLQAAVLSRVVAAIWPAAATALTLLAVLAWGVATSAWALRYGRWIGQHTPRHGASRPT